jgi:hypothetical protein
MPLSWQDNRLPLIVKNSKRTVRAPRYVRQRMPAAAIRNYRRGDRRPLSDVMYYNAYCQLDFDRSA